MTKRSPIKPLILYIPVLFILNACVTTDKENIQYYLERKGALFPQNSTQKLSHCHGYGCKFTPTTSLTKAEWNKIKALFNKTASNAETERIQIKQSIAMFEEIIGSKMQTEHDIYGTFQRLGDKQLDCVDESTNTTSYLILLQQKKLLTYHDVTSPAVRLPLIHGGRWPHQSATIIEKETQITYVVDSWFHDNGFAPEIIPLSTWRQGWKPKTHHRHKDTTL